MNAATTRRFPRSVERALAEREGAPAWRVDDDLGQARADYLAWLELWRERNGLAGGLEAFEFLVESARRLVYLEEAVV
jgi:hypothetical protein